MIANKPMTHSELRKTIQVIIKANGVKAYNHFNQGQNYTRKKGVILNQLLKEWLNPSKKAPLPKQTIKKLDNAIDLRLKRIEDKIDMLISKLS